MIKEEIGDLRGFENLELKIGELIAQINTTRKEKKIVQAQMEQFIKELSASKQRNDDLQKENKRFSDERKVLCKKIEKMLEMIDRAAVF